MSSFAERQAALVAQILGNFSRGPQSYAHNINRCFSPFDLPLGEHEQHLYADVKCCAPVSNSGHDDVNLGACNVADGWWQQCGFGFGFGLGLGVESWPKPVPERSNCHFISMPAQAIFHAKDEDHTDAQLSLPVWQKQPRLSEVCCKESYVKRPRSGSLYAVDETVKKIPCAAPALAGLRTAARMSYDSISVPPSPISIEPPPSPQVSSDVRLLSPPPFCVTVSSSPASSQTQQSEEKPQLQSYRNPSNMSLEPQSIAARQRRIVIREKIRSLEKLIPQDSKLDLSRKLEEAIKYIKFLKAQVQILECMPQGDSKPDLKSNPNSANANAPISLRSNARSGSGWNVSLTNALTVQRSACMFKKLSPRQMLHILLTSPTIQRKLFNAEKVIVTVQQKDILSFSSDFSNFSSD